MNGKELVQTMLRLFFPIWGAVFIAGVVSMFVLDYVFIRFNYIALLMILAPLLTLSLVVHYSKRELSKNQMIVRYVIHAMLTLLIVVASLVFHWSNFDWSYLLIIIPAHLVGYCIVLAVDELHTKRLLSKLREVSQ